MTKQRFTPEFADEAVRLAHTSGRTHERHAHTRRVARIMQRIDPHGTRKSESAGCRCRARFGRSRQADGIYDSDSGWEFSAFLIVSLLVLAALGDGPFALKPDTLEGPSVVPAR